MTEVLIAQIPSALQKMRMAGGALLSFAMMAVLMAGTWILGRPRNATTRP
jgi:hypothetical protein